jgi:hypothetical protein
LTTRIPLFAQSPFFEPRLSVEHPAQIGELLVQAVAESPEDYRRELSRIASQLATYQSAFAARVNGLYASLLR